MSPQSKLHPLVKVLSGVVATAQEDGGGDYAHWAGCQHQNTFLLEHLR